MGSSANAISESPAEGWFTNEGLNLRFVEWGSPEKPAIVMLHGLRSYAHTWEPVALALLDRWRVIALDQRGRGRSDWDPKGNYYTEDYVRDLEALADHLALRRFVLLGHSMGGANGFVYAARHPDRVAALVVEDMGPGASANSGGADRIRRELNETPSSFATWSDAAAFWRRIRPDISAEALQSRVKHSLKQGEDGMVTWCHDAVGIASARLSAAPGKIVDLWPHVEALQMPTLLIRGANSDFLSAATAEDMCRRNARIRRADVPGATHYVHDDNLAGFNAVLQDFLTRVLGSSASWI
ncbi:pimeloyl-ACP methyl ester carboxylesterase [Bradyrhizobium diazoefficiens]|uniref:alpha/beta fold hydrolase n=1 Tax=Bradyrhizobium diazoefficiens TaxID=1355477 RepID=UPI003519D413